MPQSKHLYQVVYQSLLSEIEGGIYPEGARLPSENDLAQRFNVSQITTKKALNMLVEKGLIVRRPGLGSFICHLETVPVITSQPYREDAFHKNLIGVLMEDFTSSYGIDMLRAIEKSATEKGYHLCVKRSMGDQHKEESAISRFCDLHVAGLLVMPTHGSHYNTEILRLVVEGFPLVFIDRFLSGIPAPYVGADNKRAAADLTEALLLRGHTKIAMITAPTKEATTLGERYDGFVDAQKSYGIKFDRRYLLDSIYSTLPSTDPTETISTEVSRISAFLKEQKEVTAVFATEYGIATMVKRACHEAGIRIPEDISLVCFDGPSGPEDEIFFTHIRQNESEIGDMAVNILISQINNDSKQQSIKQQSVPAILVEGISVRSI